MSRDPFEAGRASGKAEADAERARSEDYRRRCEAATEKFYNLLKPKFVYHGYYLEKKSAWAPSLDIDPDSPVDRLAAFSITGSYEGKGYSVSDHSARHSVFERDCSEERVLELAGNFFGRTIELKKERTIKENEARKKWQKEQDLLHKSKKNEQRQIPSTITNYSSSNSNTSSKTWVLIFIAAGSFLWVALSR